MFFCVIDESFHLFIYFLETSMYDQKSYVFLKTMNFEDNWHMIKWGYMINAIGKPNQPNYTNQFLEGRVSLDR